MMRLLVHVRLHYSLQSSYNGPFCLTLNDHLKIHDYFFSSACGSGELTCEEEALANQYMNIICFLYICILYVIFTCDLVTYIHISV